jgi:hypothetical protein
MTDFADRIPIVCECGDHAFVAITRGLTTMVSPEDAHLLERRWVATPHTRYSSRVMAGDGRSTRHLGRAVLQLSDPGLWADHISGDPLDNRRSNLRPATPSQNAYNRRLNTWRDLPRGVHRNKGGFQAEITVNGRRWKLGTFRTPEEAHAAYVAAAQEHHGEFRAVRA